MKDLFGNKIQEITYRVNIYADEIFSKECPYTGDEWFYTGLIAEDSNNSLLNDVIDERYMGNFDKTSPYFQKNDRIVHWSEINDADTYNIAKRWLEYILNPSKSGQKFYTYILGINNSKLNKEEFGGYSFNNRYNRFFRSAILYALKTMFPSKEIIVNGIYHEEGQQKHHDYFPWHCIYKIESNEKNIQFKRRTITFLPKNHREDVRSNIIQLCDLFLGMCTSSLHGIKKSKRSHYREELMQIFLPLFKRMVGEPYNKNSSYKHSNRIIIRFFPKEKLAPDDIRRLMNQFYCERRIYFLEEKSVQMELFPPYRSLRMRTPN